MHLIPCGEASFYFGASSGVWLHPEPLHRVRGGRSLRLPTEPCVWVHTRLLTQVVSIELPQTNAPVSGWIVFPALSN